jgi:MoaA/NifB/PqqE/SkfB family radical SAM enzyme
VDHLVAFVISVLANLVFSANSIAAYLRKRKRRQTLLRFWGKPIGNSRRAYIYYPSYPIPKVGRTEKQIGYYLADEDAKAVEILEQTLSPLGFECHRKLVSQLPSYFSIQKDGIVILVCGPKLDTTTNQVVLYDSWIGGNPVSSWFYRKHHEALGIELTYNRVLKRKEYHFRNAAPLYSPRDASGNSDTGILIRYFASDNQRFFLCWGIHGDATLGTVEAACDVPSLAEVPQHTLNILASVETSVDSSDTVSATTKWREIMGSDVDPDIKKPDPFVPGAWLRAEQLVYGLSYLWASADNVEAIKIGDYSKLRPVAAEFDLSLKCPYCCSWCPYRSYRKGGLVVDNMTAQAIVDKLAKDGVRLVVLTGGGEPLESTCVESVVERCRKHDMLVTLYTNGLLLTRLRVFDLMSKGISEIRFSLDDISDLEAYMSIHGLKNDQKDAMATVQGNIQQALELRTKNGFDTRIGASFVVSGRNVGHLVGSVATLEQWLARVGPFDYVAIRPAVKYWPGGREFELFKGDQLQVRALNDAAEKFIEKQVARHLVISRQRFRDLLPQTAGSHYDRCLASPLWLNIGPDGTAYLCCETKHNPACKIGNYLREPLDQLLESPVIRLKREIPFGAKGCPLLLCKPSSLNSMLHHVESSRKVDGSLPESIIDWLDGVAKYNREFGEAEAFIPSVSGVYEDYSLRT